MPTAMTTLPGSALAGEFRRAFPVQTWLLASDDDEQEVTM
jgi:hypothetical protein